MNQPQVPPRPLAWILCLLFSSAFSWSPAEGEPSHYQAKKFKRKCEIWIISPHSWHRNLTYWKLPSKLILTLCVFFQHLSRITFVLHFAIFCKGATTAAHIRETRSRACEKAGSALPITPWRPKQWYCSYFPSTNPRLKGSIRPLSIQRWFTRFKSDKKVLLSILNSVYHTSTMNVWYENESLLRYGVNYW